MGIFKRKQCTARRIANKLGDVLITVAAIPVAGVIMVNKGINEYQKHKADEKRKAEKKGKGIRFIVVRY